MDNKFDFEDERNADLMRNFKELLHKSKHIHMPTVYSQLVKLPARRFWVSEKRAAIVVGRMMRGCDLSKMNPVKAEMFREIYKRTMEMRNGDDTDKESIYKTDSEVIMQQAPRFYLTPNSAKVIICRLNRKEKRRRKGLQHE